MPRAAPAERMLSVRETAQVLGVCLDTARRQLRSGQLQGVKIGHSWRIPESQLVSRFGLEAEQLPPNTEEEKPAVNLAPSRAEGEVVDALFRSEPVRDAIAQLVSEALANAKIPPRLSRHLLRNLEDLLDQS